MKTVISVPDAVFSRAEVFARRRRMTRSALFTVAVDEYVQQRHAEDVTRKLNEIYAKEDSALDPVLERLQTLSLPMKACCWS
jgi:metal-responsive CopG/Arc/MetJ family transcriptional regulator